MTAGYSGTPLIKKLGLKPGLRVFFWNPPADYAATLGELPPDVTVAAKLDGLFDFIQFFSTERSELQSQLPMLKAALKPTGLLWISWPKKAAKVPTDITEDVLREVILPSGLVDVKVCAVDAVWSGLKFVHRLKDR